jgi:hypothetical protein
VRATVVQGTALRIVMWSSGSERTQWRRMPGRGLTLRATVTSDARAVAGIRSHRAAAERWLSAAPSPTASTAASQCPSILSSLGPTTP